VLKTRHFYRFGDFRLDGTAKVLERAGEPIRLLRKAVETLLVLAEHPDLVLTKEELIEEIWQGRVVDEANLMQNIAVVRKALGLKSGEPGYIETFPGRGYRLLGPIFSEYPEPAVQPAPLTAEPAPAEDRPIPKPGRPRWFYLAAYLLIGFVAAGAFLLLALKFRRSPAPSAAYPHPVPVARLDGKEFQASISPDGKDVAFILDRGDGHACQLWIKFSNRVQPVSLSSGDWDYASPAWSPDGRLLAYLRFSARTGELVIVNRDGAGERVATQVFKTRHGLYYRHLAWSPDGKWLAVDDAASPGEPFSLFLVSTRTAERRRLTTPPNHWIGDVEPRFSPDGSRLTFIRVIHRSTQALMLARPDGAILRQFSKDGTQVSGQDWSADGKSVVFASNSGGEFRLWKIAAFDPRSVPAPDAPSIFADAPIQPALARNAPALVYSVLRQDFNIWRLNLGAHDLAVGRWTPVVNSSAQDASPQYSPDGKEICFRSDRSGDEQIWVAAADGSRPQQVTDGHLNPSVGRWSPDGRSIVFNDSRRMDQYVTSRDANGKWTVRPLGVKGTHPVYSKSGDSIYFGRNDSAVEAILRVSAAGGAPVEIAKTHGLSFGLSADGRDLYFVHDLADTRLWKMSLATGSLTPLLDGLVPYCTSCWAASDTGVYYLGTDRSSVVGQAIFFHSFQRGPDRIVAQYPEVLPPLGSGPFSLSPDGRYLLCVRVDSPRADLMRVEPYR
jgi:Tol biopolymer transport system component/DNA-binding winged helix-turn-helix (wHTH) protein